MRSWKYAMSAAALSVAIVMYSALTSTTQAQLELLESAKDAIGSLGGSTGGASVLTDAEIGDGLIEALMIGTERVVSQVGAADGYNLDPDIHIPLPGSLADVQKVLNSIGMSSLTDDLELKLNRAAEAAAPEAKEVFWEAISDMTLDDVQQIYNGPDDAATRYFQEKMTPTLAERMKPIVDSSLADVGAIQSYDNMMKQYESVPFVPDVKADMTDYAVEQAMDGMFYYVAKEEAAIRNDPAARSTELLQKVFGSN